MEWHFYILNGQQILKAPVQVLKEARMDMRIEPIATIGFFKEVVCEVEDGAGICSPAQHTVGLAAHGFASDQKSMADARKYFFHKEGVLQTRVKIPVAVVGMDAVELEQVAHPLPERPLHVDVVMT